jgi:hypothetical protein
MPSIVYSCVVDRQPLYRFQGLLFAHSLIVFAGVTPNAIVLHLIEGVPKTTHTALERLGVQVVTTKPFDPRHPPSNKLLQLGSQALRAAEYVALCDSDLAFAAPIDPWLGGTKLRAKPVDYARPPMQAWRELMPALGFKDDIPSVPATHSGEATYANNFNGGLYIVPQQVLEGLRTAWPKWNRQLLDRAELLGPYRFHTDQISLAVALADLGEIGDPLPLELNLPTNLPLPDQACFKEAPRVLHYHRYMDLSGRLIPMGVPVVDGAIRRVNEMIAARRLSAELKAGLALKIALVKPFLRRVLSS